ncbi:tyrosine--tRNA ligase [Buchnera aphidicola (Thelaxes californica)]|uniref:Tyrosine--tRNA ligase n=1 Tax=Buchnera aphidicola (Thelaxes californica) TaxID=1315998 RepID=A0A4D6YL28_9GAMM|nr:tyrosine--tRNA ligase [Buchnera aphidicola]QCI26650.1 tyrosine--tRNA ligase [Buchnera aphidicola (Thelaxes californica)]
MNIIEELHQKNLIFNISNNQDLIKKINEKSISLYCGFDPTAESLHVGHLLPLLVLRLFQKCGHKPIVLIGGATSLIGDPSFKEKKREDICFEVIKIWEKNIVTQIKKFLNFNHHCNSALIINNYEWFNEINLLTFLKDIGKYFSINSMINKESVKKRIQRIDQGISFTEFSYSLLQAYDYFFLYKKYHTILQIGGSDQWGNIVSGINLIRKKLNKQVFGLTIPLFIKSNGKKFGKTESGNIWLDPKKTTPYEFYQFWMNITDSEALYFANILNITSMHEVNTFQKKDKNLIIEMKKILAKEITILVHGKKEYTIAKNISNNLFSNNIIGLEESDFQCFFTNSSIKNIPIFYFKYVDNIQLRKLLTEVKLSTSWKHASNLIVSKGIKINGKIESNSNYFITCKDVLFKKYTILCKGKKKFILVKWI